MEVAGFVGTFDKKDLLLDLAKVLEIMKYKVLIIDATTQQRLRYIVPRINRNTITYVSEYQGIDVALGFMNVPQIMQYLGTTELSYDIVLIDTDNIQTFNSFGLATLKKLFLVTSYDAYELGKMLEIVRYIQNPITATKVIYSADITRDQQKYMDSQIKKTNVKLSEDIVEFADSIEDRKATLENQLVREIRFKNHSESYKYSLEYLTDLVGDGLIDKGSVGRMIKKN